MGSIILYCRLCWAGYASLGERPMKCPACDRFPYWTTVYRNDIPKKPYELTRKDWCFLHALHIDPEQTLGAVET